MTGWTPRPLSPDEPACWSWLAPPLDGLDARYTRLVLVFQPAADFMGAMASAKALGPRPVTPWPEWSPDATVEQLLLP